jgi:hypothetical protein
LAKPPALIRMNTQTEDLGARAPWKFDLVHVDADHSYHGAMRDMVAAWKLCTRVMLVDDYTPNAAVHDAVDAFVRQTSAKLIVGAGRLGEAIILKGNA